MERDVIEEETAGAALKTWALKEMLVLGGKPEVTKMERKLGSHRRQKTLHKPAQ